MELPDLGEHCQEKNCNTLDFLPFKCDACQKIFCKDHYNYANHRCNSLMAKNKDFQVPICPLCNQPVPFKRNELPDILMSAHIDRDCKSDPAEDRRRQIFSNKCFKKACKKKELLPFICGKCQRNYCIRHRNEIDHECDQISKASFEKEVNSKRLYNIFERQQQAASRNASSSKVEARAQSVQPSSLSDKEAMDLAIKLSMQESSASKSATVSHGASSTVVETEDEILARVLAQSESEYKKKKEEENKDSACLIG